MRIHFQRPQKYKDQALSRQSKILTILTTLKRTLLKVLSARTSTNIVPNENIMKLDMFVLPLCGLSTLAAALPAPRPDAAAEPGNGKRSNLEVRFVPSIIPYKDYSEDQEDEPEGKKLKARFVPSIIPYKDYSEDLEDESESMKLKARFVPSIIPYKDYSEDEDTMDARNVGK